MNTYDFDKTIFYPDSSYTFIVWYLRRHPLQRLRMMPRLIWFGLLYLLRIIPKEEIKSGTFYFLRWIPDLEKEINLFWDEHEAGICKWYLDQKRDDDLIISASPEFIIGNISKRLGVSFISTKMDNSTGRIIGTNCSGAEKVRRFRELFPNGVTEAFYSDSLSDTPMAKIADKAYLIVDKGQRIVPWPEK